METAESQRTSNAATALENETVLLHSFSAFRGILAPLLAVLRPQSICEIGVEGGLGAGFLLECCREIGCRYTGIDPALPDPVRQMIEDAGHRLVPKKSLAVLADLPLQDVYFIDGDHNYYTVRNELAIILNAARRADRYPCILLHDVAWPCARRDFYYCPSDIPDEARHEYDFECGVALDHPELVRGGFRSCGIYALAKREGGPRNGVLTAVEDALVDGNSDWELIIIPVVFGLGILYHPASLPAEQLAYFWNLRETLDRVGALLAILERNRIVLYLRVLSYQDHLHDLTDYLRRSHEQIVALATQLTHEPDRIPRMESELRRLAAEKQNLEAELARSRASNQCLTFDLLCQRERVAGLSLEVAGIKASKAYRATGPLRALLDGVRGAKPLAGRLLRGREQWAAWWRAPRVSDPRGVLGHVGERRIVSFDIFDTLLARNIEPPDFIKRRSAKFAEIQLRRRGLPLTYELFLQARTHAEAQLRSVAQQRGLDHEARFRDIIHRALALLFGAPVAEQETDRIVEYELAVEKQHLLLMPGARELVDELLRRGKRLVAVSDMYLEGHHLQTLLANVGLADAVSRIYASSDHYMGKYSGRLFRLMLEREGAQPGEVLHVGDNLVSDVLAAQKVGIAAVWLRDRTGARRRRRLAQLTARALDPGDARGLLAHFAAEATQS
jgi:HAD superfamily hydrolase (TIGR01549 family)